MDASYPFGNPDGSRSELADLMAGFIEFKGGLFGRGLAAAPDDLAIRVIVGAKGSGKTVYLRRQYAAAAGNQAVYAEQIQQDLPATSDVIRFCQTFPKHLAIERWSDLWKCAILRSVLSHLLCTPQLAVTDSSALRSFEGILHPEFRVAHSVYSQAVSILYQHRTQNQFERYFRHDGWYELETRIAGALSSAPPLWIFIDAVDEEYARAPSYWVRCQMGLFERVMRLLRDVRLGGRLHVAISLRDHVFSAILQGESIAKNADEPHIRKLVWDCHAIRHFLREKIARLPEGCLMRPGSEDSIERWLGATKIRNCKREIDETVEDYLIRHTRMLPRDVILVGNRMCSEVHRARLGGESQVDPARIRDAVADIAKLFGEEQLAVCANQVAADMMPVAAGRHEITEAYIGVEAYRQQLADSLRSLVSKTTHDHFSGDVLRRLNTDFLEEKGHPEVFSILWQHGLVGYREGDAHRPDRFVFFSMDRPGAYSLPVNKAEYVFHSILIDTVGLEPSGELPVMPS